MHYMQICIRGQSVLATFEAVCLSETVCSCNATAGHWLSARPQVERTASDRLLPCMSMEHAWNISLGVRDDGVCTKVAFAIENQRYL